MQTWKPPRTLCGISIWCSSSILFTSVAKSTIKMKVYLTFNWPQDYIWLKQWEHRSLGGETWWSVLVRTQLWKIGCFSPHRLSPASGWVIPRELQKFPSKTRFFLNSIFPFLSFINSRNEGDSGSNMGEYVRLADDISNGGIAHWLFRSSYGPCHIETGISFQIQRSMTASISTPLTPLHAPKEKLLTIFYGF